MNVKAFAGDPFRVAQEINQFNSNGYNIQSVTTVSEAVTSGNTSSYPTKVAGSILVVITYEVQD